MFKFITENEMLSSCDGNIKFNVCFSVLQQSNARPKTSLRPPSARPISARPAAPRMRAKTEIIVNEEIQ